MHYKENYHYNSPRASNKYPEMFQRDMYTRERAKDMEIERLNLCLNQKQKEIGALKLLKNKLSANIEVISVDCIQAKNLLTHETHENMHLTFQLNLLKREIEELRDRLTVSQRAESGISYGHMCSNGSYATPTTRVYSNEIEEMRQILITKVQELEKMRETCKKERKEKLNYFKSYEEALKLLEKEIART